VKALFKTLVPLILIIGITYILEVIPGGPYWRPHNIVDASYEATKDSLNAMKDWAVWMAGIQVAVLGGVSALAKDGGLTEKQKAAAIPTALLNSAGLLFTAWTLSSIPSLLLRVSGSCKELPAKVPGQCDFYELPFMGNNMAPHFAFFSTWQHWLWAAGLLSFAWLAFVSINRPAKHIAGKEV